MTVRQISLGVLLVALAGTANAGEIHVRAETFPFMEKQPKVELKTSSPDIHLNEKKDGIWSFSFEEKAPFRALVTVDVDNPPDYRSVPLSFEIPFYWDGPEPVELAGATVDKGTDAEAQLAFLTAARVKPSGIPELVLLNHRARQLWRAREPELEWRTPNKDDVRLAYQLLFTTWQLVDKRFLQLDPTTQSALDWLSSILESPDSDRLLRTDTASANTISELTRNLRERDAIVFRRLVQKTSGYIVPHMPKRMVQGCARAAQIKSYLDELDTDRKVEFDPRGLGEFETLINVALCKTRALKALKSPETPSADDLNEAEQLHNEMIAAIDQWKEKGGDAKLRQLAERQAADLSQTITYFKSLGSG